MKLGFWELVLLFCIILILFGPTVIPWIRRWLRRADQTRQQAIRHRDAVRRQAAQERDAILHRFQVVTSVFLIGGCVVYSGYLLFHPVSPVPQRYTPSDAALALTTSGSSQTTTLDLSPYENPICVAEQDGWLYAATADQQVIRIRPDGSGLALVCTTESPVTAMTFAADGSLYLAGQTALYRASFDGWGVDVKPILTTIDGQPLTMAAGIAPACDGRIYFTQYADFPAENPTQSFFDELMAHTASGSVWVWDPVHNTTEQLVTGLSGAGGLTLSPDSSTLYVSEANARRVWSLPVDTRNATIQDAGEILLEGMDGYAAGLSPARNGGIWVAVCGQPISWVDGIANQPWLRRVVMNLPQMTQAWLLTPSASSGWAFTAAPDGTLSRAVAAQLPKIHGRITGVCETEETIWLANADGSSLYGVTR